MRPILPLALLIFAGGAAQSADAAYFIGQGTAEHHVREYFHYNVGYHYTAASCRPQGRRAPEPGYIYHRWTCIFAVGDSRFSPSCTGQALVTGSGSVGRYYLRVLWHDGACPLGVSG